MKKIFKEAHKMTKEIASKYDVDYQAQFGLCLAYLLNKEEEKEMIKLYEIDGELFFADTKTDKVYEIGFGNELVEQYDTVIDDWFDIEDAKEVKMEDYYNVEYVVDEKDTYSIKEQIKAEGGKWDGSVWTVPAPSKNFKTKMLITEK